MGKMKELYTIAQETQIDPTIDGPLSDGDVLDALRFHRPSAVCAAEGGRTVSSFRLRGFPSASFDRHLGLFSDR
jgi:hypothetical protein